VKLQGAAIERFLGCPDAAVRAALIFGPDEGLVRERAQRLGRHVVSDLADPFRVAQLAADAVAADPTLLADEASALSLMGGRRLVRVRDATDKLTRALAALLDGPPADSLIIIEAGDLGTRSSLRKLAEGAPAAAAIPCYVEDAAALSQTLDAQIARAGKAIDRDALRLLAASVVGDRMMALGEVEKLLLYKGADRTIAIADVENTIVDTAAIGMDDAIRAAMEADFAALDRCLTRLAGENISGIGLLRIAQNHFRRLHLTRARVDGGAPIDRALSLLQPPLFFKAKDGFAADVRRWPLSRIQSALDRLADAEAASKRTGANDFLLASDALFAIARGVAGMKARAPAYSDVGR
jgi:DNA polymerase-3 subunit delta